MQDLKTLPCHFHFLSVLQEILADGGHPTGIACLRMFEDIAYWRARLRQVFGGGSISGIYPHGACKHIETIYICYIHMKYMSSSQNSLSQSLIQIWKHEVSHNSGNNIWENPHISHMLKRCFCWWCNGSPSVKKGWVCVRRLPVWGWLRKTVVRASQVPWTSTAPWSFMRPWLGRVRYPDWYISTYMLHLP